MIRCLILLSLCFVSLPIDAQEKIDEKDAKLQTLNGHFPFKVPDEVQQWHARRETLRRRVQVATGLWPLPEKTPLNAQIYGKVSREGFTVEKVNFESLPGHFVTGLLFRPSTENQNGATSRKRPAVLSPHGHGGRTMRLTDKELAKQIESGGEIYEKSGRYPKLARCAHLARMGCVSFIFDMLGYADSQQISHPIAHRHATARPEESNNETPCFFSMDADLHLQSIMGLQTWNAIRSLDFLAQLPDVDAERLGVTGGSGGGTQSILLGAIDDRVKVSFPNGMVSTSMQGGCYCENCNYLRIGTGNVELAALFAPRPQGMTAADDWTRDMMSDGYPELQTLYALLGKPQNVMCRPLLHFPHNYNYVTRATMYPWIAKHLGLPASTPLVEQDFEPLTEEEMSVWDDAHPAPTEVGVEHERNVLAWWKQQSQNAIAKTIPTVQDTPKDRVSKLAQYQRLVGDAWRIIFDRERPASEQVTLTRTNDTDDEHSTVGYRVLNSEWNLDFNIQVLAPHSNPSECKRTVVIVSTSVPPSDQNRATGLTMYAKTRWDDSDSRFVILQLPFHGDSQALIDDPRSYSAFTFGYNRPLVVKRYEKILSVVTAFAEKDRPLHLLSTGDEIAMSAVAAASLSGESIASFTIESSHEANVTAYDDAAFLPGSQKYLGLAGLLALRAPLDTNVLTNEPERFEITSVIFNAADAAGKIELTPYAN